MREEHDIFHAASVDEEIIQAELHQPEYQQSIKRFPNPSLDDRVHMVHMLRVITQQETQNTMNDLNQAWQRIVTSHQYETHVQPERTDDTITHPTPIWNAQSTTMQRGKTSGTTEILFEKQRSRRMLTILSAVACIALVVGSMLWITNRVQTSKVASNQHNGKTTSAANATALQATLAYTYTQTGDSSVSSIIWSPVGGRLLSVGTTIQVWDFTHTFLSLTNPSLWPSQDTVWSPDGTSIAINNIVTGIEIRNATTGQLQRTCAAPTSSVAQTQPGTDIQSQHQSLLSSKVPYTSRFTAGSGAGPFNLVWSPDGKYLAATFYAPGANSFTTRFVGLVVYTTADCSIAWQTTTNGWNNLIAWSPDSNYLALSSGQGADIVNFATKQVVYTYPYDATVKYSPNIDSISWSPDGKRIAMHESDNTEEFISISDALTGAHSFTYKGAHSATYGSLIAWSPDSKYILSIDDFGAGTIIDSVAHIWNTTTGHIIHSFSFTSITLPSAVAWSPDGDYIAISHAAQKDAAVDVWHISHL